MIKMHILFLACFIISGISKLSSQSILEGFDDVPVIYQNGWVEKNNSSPLGPGTWKQDYGNFEAYSGHDSSSIVCSYNSTDPNGTGTISNWLFTPVLTMNPGDTLWFYTRSYLNNFYPDRMEVRYSENGNSTNVGTTSTSVGDFDSLLLVINENLQMSTAYPTVWTRYSIPIPVSGVNVQGRIAFRYFVTNGGGEGSNSSVIGLDDFWYASITDVGVNYLETPTLVIYPNPTRNFVVIQATESEIERLEILDIHGKINEFEIHQMSYSLNVQSWTPGMYIVKVYWKGVEQPSIQKLLVQ